MILPKTCGIWELAVCGISCLVSLHFLVLIIVGSDVISEIECKLLGNSSAVIVELEDGGSGVVIRLLLTLSCLVLGAVSFYS